MTLWKGLFILALFIVSQAEDNFDKVLENVETCEESCMKSYGPNSTDYDACLRGCRFYTIAYFVSNRGTKNDLAHGNTIDDVSPVKKLCFGSCIESYNETSQSTVACKSGCTAQEEADSKLPKDENINMHLVQPVMQIREVYSQVVGAYHVIRSSLLTYFVQDDNKLLAVESPPKIMIAVIPESGEGDYESNPFGQPEARFAELNVAGDKESSSDEPTVVSCLSHQFGVPPYLLVVSGMAIVLFTIYIIFAVCSTATPTKVKNYATGLSIQADSTTLPVKLVRPEDLTRLSLMEEDDSQAPALPHKVKLPNAEV